MKRETINSEGAIRALKVTHAAIEAVDEIMADIARRGERMRYQKKAAKETMRQEWITIIVRNVLDDLREL